MTKRLLSTVLALIVAVGILPLNVQTSAAKTDGCYNVSAAIKYAEKNWNNGIGLCADFASKCLQAGGVDVYGDTVKQLYDSLKGTYGKAYKLTLTGGKRGTVSMADNKGKIEKGDPIFYKCNYCGDFEHVVICNGANSAGYSQDYAHNKAHNGKKQTYTYNHCGGDSWTLYSINMYHAPKLYGKKTSVGVPEISAAKNGADGIVIKWSDVKEADKYKVYRKDGKKSFECVGSTASESFTDKTAKNGVKYTYTIKAVDGKKTSQYYAGESVKCLASPKLVSVSNKSDSIQFQWGKVGSADGYFVYRKTSGASWQKIAKLKGAGKLSYVDENIEDGKKYVYTVKAYDGSLTGSYNGSGKKIIYLKTPEVYAESTAEGISIGIEDISGAKGYRVYRQTDSGKWQKIAEVTDGSKSFVDTNVKNGESYTYTVKAFNGSSVSLYNKKGVACEFLGDSVVGAPEISVNK